ncbi:MAG TPA: dihydrofolate reductase family protein [Terriglobia bacterium]|nr:dihydrofolate reductase family protein [Terriglobia bacterium]
MALLKTISEDYKSITHLRFPGAKEQVPSVLEEEARLVKIPACYYVATSIDGLIADRSGNVDWLGRFFDVDYGFHGFLDSVDTVVMGRRTYERILKNARTNPYEGKLFVVLSRTWKTGPYAHLFWHGPLEDLMRRLEGFGSKSLWIVGGGSVAGTFLEAGLLDEVRQFVMPLVLGSGTPLFGPLREHASLRLKDSQSFANGVLQLTYAPGS